jgi:uncharacterized protein with NRDE domain
MCLLVLAYRVDPKRPIVLAANRDELYARPSSALSVWPDEPEICAGRDLSQGGTWLGMTRSGRFAALTNFRRGGAQVGARSRGEVVLDFLRSSLSPERYMAELAGHADQFGGFSVIAGDLEHDPYYFSNQGNVSRRLPPGTYGLSNQWLDEPWPKVTRAKERIGALIAAGQLAPEALCDAMDDRYQPLDEHLPDTGIGLARERMLAPIFITGQEYGTRAVTALIMASERRAVVYERSYGPGGRFLSEARCELALGAGGQATMG